MLPLIDPLTELAIARATKVIDAFPAQYAARWLAGVRAKLGLAAAGDGDAALAADWLALLAAHAVDFTLAWRRLGDAAAGDERPLAALFADPAAPVDWLARWRRRLELEPHSGDQRCAAMHRVNPLYIPRNHRVVEALAAASTHADLAPRALGVNREGAGRSDTEPLCQTGALCGLSASLSGRRPEWPRLRGKGVLDDAPGARDHAVA